MFIDDKIFEPYLYENCERLAKKEILVLGEKKDADYWFNFAVKTFATPAINWVATECKIIIEGISYDGIVMIHKDGRVCPMMRDSFQKIYG